MDKILVKSKYNIKLHRGFYTFHMLRKSTSIYFYLAATLLFIYMAINITRDPDASVSNIIIYWGFSMVALIALPTFTFTRINTIVRHNKKERADQYEIIEITKDKIVRFIQGVEGKIVLGWEHFESVYEVKECFYMYIDKDRGLVIPKSDIVEGNLDTLRKLIKKNLKPNKKGKVNFKIMYKDVKND